MSGPPRMAGERGFRAGARWWLHPRRLLACGLGTGLSARAPGTCGTLLGVALYLPMAALPVPLYLAVLGVFFGVGVWACGRTAEELGGRDPAVVVWDEVTGYLSGMIAAPPGWGWMLAGFALFRFFDIVKPWPVRAAERARGGFGIMLDDLVAGACTFALLQVTAPAVARVA